MSEENIVVRVARRLREQHEENLNLRGYPKLSTSWDDLPEARREKWYALARAAIDELS